MTETALEHPDDESLRGLSLGQLAADERAQISAHLDVCPACCRRIDQLTTDDHLLGRLQQIAASQHQALVNHAQRRRAVRALRHSEDGRSATRKPDPQVVPESRPVPKFIGDYEVLTEVGRGGMGVVYKARHRGLHRLAAVKMVLAGEFASPAQELRFRLEAELGARVLHPNIVQVYEIGSYEGRPFLALEWVEGGSLANRLDGKPWPPDEAASLIETLARAINLAHDEGVIHRDLKPANIMLAGNTLGNLANDETPSTQGGKDHAQDPKALVPKITDFGLAQTIDGGPMMTQSGFLVGTPGYMAPEQAGGNRALVGPATDIYALGVVLYQLLTGQLPFQGDSTLELLRALASDEPIRPRRLRPSLPRDLEAITLHCLEKEPGRRYPSALALAADLRCFQERKQVAARPVGAAARLARACRRRPLVALLLALLTVSMLGGMGGVTWKWLEANEQRDLANAHARQADAEKKVAYYQAYRASLAAASAAIQNHDVGDAARQLESAPETLRNWEWRHLHSRLDDSSSIVPLPAGAGGFLIATPERLQIGDLTTTGLRITDLDGGATRTVAIAPERTRRVSVTQTGVGLRIAVRVDDTAFDLLDAAGRILCRVGKLESEATTTVVVSPDGARIACGIDGELKRVAVFDAASGKQTSICIGHDDAIRTITFSPDGSRLATGSEDRTARLWDPATGTLLATYKGHTSKVLGSAFSPDGSRLVTASADATVRQWDCRTGREVEPPYDRHSAQVFSAVYSPDGHWVASAGDDRAVRVWRAIGRQDVAVLHGHTGRVSDLAFAPDGHRLASLSSRWEPATGGDDTVRVWDIDARATLPALHGHTRAIYPMDYSPDGRWLASGSWDSTVRLWDAQTGEPCVTLPHPSFVWGLAFGPDGTWLVTGCHLDDRLRIWDVATARVRKEIAFPGRDIYSLTISPDGTRVAATASGHASAKYSLTVCDIASGKPLFSTDGSSLAYSPDGRWLATLAADEKTVLLLDARTHETAGRFSGHESSVFKAAFSPDSHYFASCSRDRTIRVWQIGSGLCQVLRGHTEEVYAVAFHPDGTRLATAARDGAVWLWDLARGDEVVRLPGHRSFVWSLAFSPDGATLASGSGDSTVRLWDTLPLRTRYQARRAAAHLRPEAEQLVEPLWREKNDPAQVVAALRLDQMPSEALRQAVIRAVLRRSQPPEAASNNPLDLP